MVGCSSAALYRSAEGEESNQEKAFESILKMNERWSGVTTAGSYRPKEGALYQQAEVELVQSWRLQTQE